jgi:hypothetical protein
LVDPLLAVPFPLLEVMGGDPGLSDVAAHVAETLDVLRPAAHPTEAGIGPVEQSLLAPQVRVLINPYTHDEPI